MHWIDWLITLLPLTFILGFAFYSRYYVHGVADYLAAGPAPYRPLKEYMVGLYENAG